VNSGFSRFWGVVATLGLTISALIFIFATIDGSREAANPQLPMAGLILVTIMYILLIRSPVGKAIARMLDGGGATDQRTAERLAQLESHQAEWLNDQERMIELEERLDFAERILAERRDAARLPDVGSTAS